MKKRFGLLLLILCLFGCGKKDMSNIREDFIKLIEKRDSYLVKGTMEIVSNEDTFTYDVSASKDNDNYRIDLINKVNDRLQVILRNDDEVYVVTPSLNKSFKFQSEWPSNGSQVYLLDSLVKDIKDDDLNTIEKDDDNYIICTKVNYPNNKELDYEKIYLNNDLNVTKVEVLDNEDNVKIKFIVKSIDYKPKFNDDYFDIETLVEDVPKDETTSSIIEDIVYPMYLPSDTYLSSKDTINTDSGNRVILNFTGASPFTLIEEKTVINDEFEIIPVFGEPLMLADSLGALSNNSVYFTSNNVDFYLSSESLSGNELLTIAESITGNVVGVVGEK